MTNLQLPPGYTAHYTHYRRYSLSTSDPRYQRDILLQIHPDMGSLPTGGRTECRIYHGTSLIAMGAAKCSLKDNFCKRTGREIAYERALMEALQEGATSARRIGHDASMTDEPQYEYGIAHRLNPNPHRCGFITKEEAETWLQELRDNGGHDEFFSVIRRTLGPWEPATDD